MGIYLNQGNIDSNQIEVRRATAADAKIVAELGQRTFEETFSDTNTAEDMEKYLRENFSEEQIKSEMENANSIFFVASIAGKAAAYMKLNTKNAQTEPRGDNALEIQRLYVLAAFKGKHIGRALMTVAEEEARWQGLSELWLGVWEHNTAAKAFYSKLGYSRFGEHTFTLGTDRQTDFLLKKQI